MNHISHTPPEWKKYRALVDETTELEYEIISLLSAALVRREGNGEPNAHEKLQLASMKSKLKLKMDELNVLKEEVADFLKSERVLQHTSKKH
ncbi:MAG TPA: hypothetical protein VNZ86_17660 [Bacteroidia bacterium]|jgi:hypothetical protein|nr:hypothetical protein [Bacteroidia bacterium]